MRIRTAWTALSVLALSASLAAFQGQQGQTAPPTPKPDAKPADPKAAPTVAGKWNVTVETQQGAMENALELKQDGQKLTGTLSSQMGAAPVEGEFADGKLSIWFKFDAGGGTLEITMTGTLKDDGTLAGSLSGGNGQFELPWRASRAK